MDQQTMSEYLIRVEITDDIKFNMQVVVKVIKQVLEASGARIVQWGKKEEMLSAMVIENGDEDERTNA